MSEPKQSECKYCGRRMKNAHPNKKFCCTKHKDRFHNENNPRGYFAHLADRPLTIHDPADYEQTEWDHGDNGCL